MKRFIKILNWCEENPLDNSGINIINDYVCEHFFEMVIGFSVSQDEIACCYKILGYDVKKIESFVAGYYWQIST